MTLLAARPRFTSEDYPEVADEELVERILNGEPAWFELIMRRYNQRLFRVTYSILANESEAEDVIQDAYVRAYSHLDQFEGRASFATWLTKIAVYEARARAKRRRRFAPLEEVDGVNRIFTHPALRATADDDPENATAGRQLGAVLSRSIAALPQNLRETFVLREVEGLSTAETARCLSISQPNVKVRLHRARAALRRDLDRRLGKAAKQLYQFAGDRCDRIVRGVMQRIGAA